MVSVIYRSSSCVLSRSHAYLRHVSFFSSSTSTKEAQPSNGLSVSDFLIQRHLFSHKAAARIASGLTHLNNPEKADLIISTLKECGFSTTQLEKVFSSRPSFLFASAEKVIKPKIKIFQDLGLSKGEIAHVISKDPLILASSANNRIIPSLAALKKLLGSDAKVAKLLEHSSSGWLLTRDLEKTLFPNIKFLESCGVPMKQIVQHIYFFPRVLLCKPEVIRRCVDIVDEMGVSRSSKSFIYAVRTVRSLRKVNWVLKLKAFRDFGFSEDDMLKMFRTSSVTFNVSKEKIKMVIEVLLTSGKYDLSNIVKTPESLRYSIEKRYKPRLQVLRILETRKLIEDWPSLGLLCKSTDALFFERYVAPYFKKLGKVYIDDPIIKASISRVLPGLSKQMVSTII